MHRDAKQCTAEATEKSLFRTQDGKAWGLALHKWQGVMVALLELKSPTNLQPLPLGLPTGRMSVLRGPVQGVKLVSGVTPSLAACLHLGTDAVLLVSGPFNGPCGMYFHMSVTLQVLSLASLRQHHLDHGSQTLYDEGNQLSKHLPLRSKEIWAS